MKYQEPKFSVPLGSKDYTKNWEKVFKPKKKPKKKKKVVSKRRE